MTLAASSKHAYALGPDVSDFASGVIRRYKPADLPASTYLGDWAPEASIDIQNRQVAYVLHAHSRFLSSEVTMDGRTFTFRTFGRTLHIAEGGGLVEHLLEDDRRQLHAAASLPILHGLANPILWFGGLVKACRKTVASKINVTLLERALGDRHSEHLAHSVSAEYEQDIVSSLKQALRRLHFSLSTSLWVLAYITAAAVIGARWHAIAARPPSEHQFRLTILQAPYTIGIAAAGCAALIYFASRAVPILPFADANGITALRCLSIVRGRTRLKAVLLVLGLAIAASAALIMKQLP